MTPDQQRAILESAAKACGITGTFDDGICWFKHRDTGLLAPWAPLTNSADTASMCAKLGISTLFFDGEKKVSCGFLAQDSGPTMAEIVSHDGTPEGREAAWRLAASMVAAKVGGYTDE